jgi:3-deoxy-D-arabino-heptulosonate 7-phosphate (DAHP) synthase
MKFSSQFKSQKFVNYTVNGVVAGVYKQAGNFSYLIINGAGHEVPAYESQGVPRGKAALQMFEQIMLDQTLKGT